MEKIDIANNKPPKGQSVFLHFEDGSKKACYRCVCTNNECICFRDITSDETIKSINPTGWEKISVI